MISILTGILFCGAVAADELRFELGTVEVPACRAVASGSPGALRKTRLIANVATPPASEGDRRILQLCARQTQQELSEARSVHNIGLFSQLVNDYYRRCVAASAPAVEIFRVYVDHEDRCPL